MVKATEELYNDHRGMLVAIVDGFAKTPSEFDELFSVADSAFMVAAKKWKKSKGSCFSTWLYRVTNNKIKDHLRKHGSSRSTFNDDNYNWLDSLPNEHAEFVPGDSLFVKEIVDQMSSEARHVVNVVLSGPSEVLGTSVCTPKAVRGEIKRHLRAQGWKWASIWGAFREIREVLKRE